MAYNRTVFYQRERERCKNAWCRRYAGINGLCQGCQPGHHQTSDGVNQGKKKITVSKLAEAKRMRAAFMSTNAIARHFGIRRESMARYLKGETEPAPDEEEQDGS